MRQKLTPKFVAKASAAPGAERTTFWDAAMPGFGLMVTSRGHRSYVVQYRAGSTSRRLTLKSGLSLTEARREAKGVLGAVAKGGDPLQEARESRAAELDSLKAVAEEYLAREGKKLRPRTLAGRRYVFERLVNPHLGPRAIDSIKRSEIVRLLDRIEHKHGATAAHHVLAALRRLFSWHAKRSDDFRSPIIRGMDRISAKEQERKRILSEAELRAVWLAAGDVGTAYGHLIRFILLTATRLREASDMKRAELSADGMEWTIPEARYKTKHDHLIPLSEAARDVLAAIPVIGDRFIFTSNGRVPISGFGKFKRQFDVKVLAELRKHDPQATLPRWTTHDLRRTARSLMSRAGVNADHAERCLGHVIVGVRGTYDRHEYKDEKRRAFEALAREVDRIINPPPANVVPLQAKR